MDQDASTPADTSLGIGIPDVTMRTNLEDKEADMTEEMHMSMDEVVETGGKKKKNKASRFSAFSNISLSVFHRFHYRGDFLRLEGGLRQSTSVYSWGKGVNLRTAWPRRHPLVIHGSASSGQRKGCSKYLAMIQ